MKRAAAACLLGALVFAASVLPFARSAGYGLVNCDDYGYVGEHPQVVQGVSVAGIAWGCVFSGEGIWMPLTWLSYMLDYDMTAWRGGSLDKEREDVYHTMHVHSVAVHGLNALLLFLLLTQLFGRGNLVFAALAALFWSLHPLRCESVDWIASRKDVLSMAGLLISLVSWTRFRRSGAGRSVRKAVWYACSLAAFALGATAKPSVMCYPALVFVLDRFFLRRTFGSGLELVKDFCWYLVPTALAGIVGYVAMTMQAAGGCTIEFSDMPFVMRLLNACVSFGVYVIHTVLPINLAPQCILRWPHPPRLMAPGLLVTALLVWRLWRPCRREAMCLWAVLNDRGDARADTPGETALLPAVAGGVWYAISIVPFLGISGFGYHAYADRFTYIPAVGASIALLTLVRLGYRKWASVFLGAAVAALGVLCFRQTGIWENDRTMWEQTVAVDGELNGVATAGLGLWHYEHGHDLDKAVSNFEKSFAANPEFMQKTCFLHVDALAEAGRLDRAYEILKWTGEFSRMMRERQWMSEGLSAYDEEYRPITHNRLARVACFLRDPPNRKVGLEELDGLRKELPNSIHVIYLEIVAALARGDIAAAEEAWGRLRKNAARSECMRYRFVDKLIASRKEVAK